MFGFRTLLAATAAMVSGMFTPVARSGGGVAARARQPKTRRAPVFKTARSFGRRSRCMPHQSERECARRVRQMEGSPASTYRLVQRVYAEYHARPYLSDGRFCVELGERVIEGHLLYRTGLKGAHRAARRLCRRELAKLQAA